MSEDPNFDFSTGSKYDDNGFILQSEKIKSQWTDKHYNFFHELTATEEFEGRVKVDPYFVARQWKLGSKDDSGALFHCLKTIARFGDKNSREREIRALYGQIKRLAELEGVELDDSN